MSEFEIGPNEAKQIADRRINLARFTARGNGDGFLLAMLEQQRLSALEAEQSAPGSKNIAAHIYNKMQEIHKNLNTDESIDQIIDRIIQENS